MRRRHEPQEHDGTEDDKPSASVHQNGHEPADVFQDTVLTEESVARCTVCGIGEWSVCRELRAQLVESFLQLVNGSAPQRRIGLRDRQRNARKAGSPQHGRCDLDLLNSASVHTLHIQQASVEMDITVVMSAGRIPYHVPP